MSTSQQSFIKDTLEAASRLIPANSQQIRANFEKSLRSLLETQLRQMDVVGKEEFNANLQLVKRLQERVTELEKKVAALQQGSN